MVPPLFGIQQVAEGLVWIGLDQGIAPLAQSASLVFLFFALSFWPVWLPFCVLIVETRKAAKVVIGMMMVPGLAWTALLYLPILHNPDQWLTTEVVCHSVRYNYSRLPVFQVLPQEAARLCYALPIAVSFLITGNSPVRIFGFLLTAAALVSELVFWYAFTSVWCFLAAGLALFLCVVFAKLPDGRDRSVSEAATATSALQG
jgi:hypothetical protein